MQTLIHTVYCPLYKSFVLVVLVGPGKVILRRHSRGIFPTRRVLLVKSEVREVRVSQAAITMENNCTINQILRPSTREEIGRKHIFKNRDLFIEFWK